MVIVRTIDVFAISPGRSIVNNEEVTLAFVDFTISHDMSLFKGIKLVLLSFQRSGYGCCVILGV